MRKRRPDSSSSRYARALDDLRLAAAGGLGHALGARPQERVGGRRRGQLVDAELGARARDDARLHLPGAAPLAHDEVAEQAGLDSRSHAVRPSSRHQALTASRTSSMRSEARMSCSTSSIRSQRPGAVEAEHELALLVLAERVLELVAVAELLHGGHDRLDRRALEAADALERVADLRLLLLELALVRAAPATARPGAAPRGSMRSGLGSSSSTSSASAQERFDFPMRARTRSPGTAPRTNTT